MSLLLALAVLVIAAWVLHNERRAGREAAGIELEATGRCLDCEHGIVLEDDDAEICIDCAGRNRRARLTTP